MNNCFEILSNPKKSDEYMETLVNLNNYLHTNRNNINKISELFTEERINIITNLLINSKEIQLTREILILIGNICLKFSFFFYFCNIFSFSFFSFLFLSFPFLFILFILSFLYFFFSFKNSNWCNISISS